MSDRDENVRRLAERIAFAQLGWPETSEPHLSDDERGRWQQVTGSWMARLTAFLAEREDRQPPWAPIEAEAIIDALLATSRPDRELRSRAEEFAASCRRVRPATAAIERDRALGELTVLRKALEAEADLCGACSGTGKPTKMSAMVKSVAPDGSCSVCYEIRASLAESPLSKLAGELFKATEALSTIRHKDIDTPEVQHGLQDLVRTWDALRAELDGDKR